MERVKKLVSQFVGTLACLMLSLGWAVWFMAAVESGDAVLVGFLLIVTGACLAGIAAGVWESR